MKMTMELTLDGLRRALRWKALDLAERAAQGYLRPGAAAPDRRETRAKQEDADERRRD